jgi:hypothetical protein
LQSKGYNRFYENPGLAIPGVVLEKTAVCHALSQEAGLMTVIRGIIGGLLCLVLLGAAVPGRAADQPPVELPNTTGPIITDLAITQTYKTWTVQITPTLNVTGGVFNANWQRRRAGSNQANLVREIGAPGDYRNLVIPVEIFYGLTPRMDMSITTSFVQNWASNVEPSSRGANFGSLGDTSFQLRYRLLNGSPTAATVTGYVSVLCPTGHASPLEPKLLGIDQTGAGTFSFTWGLDVFKYVPRVPVLLYANIWYTNWANGWVNGARVNYPDQITANFAMEFPLKKSAGNRWAFLLEVLSSWDAWRLLGPKANQAPLALVSVLPAVEFLPCSWLTLAAGVQVPLIGRNTSFVYAPTLALYINF